MGREKDEEISAIHSIVPGDVIPVKGGEGAGTTRERRKPGQEGTAQKSSGFGIH